MKHEILLFFLNSVILLSYLALFAFVASVFDEEMRQTVEDHVEFDAFFEIFYPVLLIPAVFFLMALLCGFLVSKKFCFASLSASLVVCGILLELAIAIAAHTHDLDFPNGSWTR